MCNKSAEVVLLSFVVGLLVSTSSANPVGTSEGDPEQGFVIVGMQHSDPTALPVRDIGDLEVLNLFARYESITGPVDLVDLQFQFRGQSYGAEQFSEQMDYGKPFLRRVSEPSLSPVGTVLLLFVVAMKHG